MLNISAKKNESISGVVTNLMKLTPVSQRMQVTEEGLFFIDDTEIKETQPVVSPSLQEVETSESATPLVVADEAEEIETTNAPDMSAMVSEPTKDKVPKKADKDTTPTQVEGHVTGVHIEDGVSEGVEYLKEGYIAYAKEVISERAIPDLYDGLKPVNRKTLWTLYNDVKQGQVIKSQTVAGDTMAYHPHSADAIYKAAILMTDSHEFTQFPLIDGSGSYGNNASGEVAASMRYTEMKMHDNAKELLREMDGVDFVPNFDSTRTEPVVLPASFPYVLCNPSEGIAVGFACKIPSFNFNDVVDLTIEYLKNGKCTTVIAPDFMTGGYYIQNNKELRKLMEVGQATLKLRAKMEVQNGKEIVVKEVPFSKNVAMLCKMIDDKDFDGVVNVSNYSDFEGINLTVVCRNKSKVNDVMYALLKETDLQCSYNANLTVVQDGTPRQLGVFRIVEEWCKWRRGVVQRDTEKKVKEYKTKIKENECFMRLVNSGERKDTFVQVVTKQGKAAGRKYIEEAFTREEIPEEYIKFVSGRSIDSYHDGGQYAEEYANMLAKLKQCEEDLKDIDAALIRQLTQLKEKYGPSMPRRTEITTTDYDFSKEVVRKESKASACVYTLKDNFLHRLGGNAEPEGCEVVLKCKTDDILLAVDNRGRLLRVYPKDLNDEVSTGLGLYLPKYLGLNEKDDYKILWLDKVDGEKKLLVYNDGNFGFIDTTEFMGLKRQVKVIERGISRDADKLVEAFSTVPEVIVIEDSDGKVGWQLMSEVMIKNRTARTKVFNIRKNRVITKIGVCTAEQLQTALPNADNFKAPLTQSVKGIKFDVEAVGLTGVSIK